MGDVAGAARAYGGHERGEERDDLPAFLDDAGLGLPVEIGRRDGVDGARGFVQERVEGGVAPVRLVVLGVDRKARLRDETGWRVYQ
jgi:hypothetical protein